METGGRGWERSGRAWAGIVWGAGREAIREAQGGVFYLFFLAFDFGVCSVGGRGPEKESGPLAKTPVGLTWQPHEAAWQEESCI